MEFTYRGHAFFEVVARNGTRLVIDPFFDHPFTEKKPGDIKADLVCITHGHRDHLGSTLEIDAPVLAIHEIAQYLTRKGHKDVTGMNLGGCFTFNDVKIHMVAAFHSGGIQTDQGDFLGCGGDPAGFVIDDGEHRFYHAGDTSLFGDMRTIIGDLYEPDIAALPIGDHFTMGPEHAAIATQWLGIKAVIPIHYNTFPPVEQDPQDFIDLVKERCGDNVKVFTIKGDESFTY